LGIRREFWFRNASVTNSNAVAPSRGGPPTNLTLTFKKPGGGKKKKKAPPITPNIKKKKK